MTRSCGPSSGPPACWSSVSLACTPNSPCSAWAAPCSAGISCSSILDILPFSLSTRILLPFFLLLFGLSLLVDALRKPKGHHFSVHRHGKHQPKNTCTLDGETFTCEGCFGESDHLIQLPRLSSGTADLSFGEMTVDLSGCQEISEDCHIDLNCAFGDLTLLIPRRCCAVPHSSTAFGSVLTKGTPDPNAPTVLNVNCDVSFGQITLRYI